MNANHIAFCQVIKISHWRKAVPATMKVLLLAFVCVLVLGEVLAHRVRENASDEANKGSYRVVVTVEEIDVSAAGELICFVASLKRKSLLRARIVSSSAFLVISRCSVGSCSLEYFGDNESTQVSTIHFIMHQTTSTTLREKISHYRSSAGGRRNGRRCNNGNNSGNVFPDYGGFPGNNGNNGGDVFVDGTGNGEGNLVKNAVTLPKYARRFKRVSGLSKGVERM